jgi:hypothetical protein
MLDMNSTAPLFSPGNMDALLSHLPGGSLGAELVEILRAATSEADARALIEARVSERLQHQQGKQDAPPANA